MVVTVEEYEDDAVDDLGLRALRDRNASLALARADSLGNQSSSRESSRLGSLLTSTQEVYLHTVGARSEEALRTAIEHSSALECVQVDGFNCARFPIVIHILMLERGCTELEAINLLNSMDSETRLSYIERANELVQRVRSDAGDDSWGTDGGRRKWLLGEDIAGAIELVYGDVGSATSDVRAKHWLKPAGAAAVEEEDLAMDDPDPASDTEDAPVARTQHLASPKFAGVIPIAPGTPSHALHGLSRKILHCLVPDPELVGTDRYTGSATFVTNTLAALTLDEFAALEDVDYVGGEHFVTWIATLTVEAAVGAVDGGGDDDVDDDVDMGDNDGGGSRSAPGSPNKRKRRLRKAGPQGRATAGHNRRRGPR